MKPAPVDESELRLAIRGAVVRLAKPVSVAELRKALSKPQQRPAAELARLLAELAREGELFAVKSGASFRYTDRDPKVIVGAAIQGALREGPLSKKDLTSRVKRAAAGFDKLLAAVLKAEIERGAVREHPKAGNQSLRYGLEPPDPAPFLAKAVKELAAVAKKLAASGVTKAAIHAAIGRALGVEAASPRSAQAADPAADDAAIFAALRDLAAREPSGSLLSVRAWRALSTLDKNRFDAAALRLARAGAIALHHHDFPESLPEGERASLVRDERGVHYVGVAPRGEGGRG